MRNIGELRQAVYDYMNIDGPAIVDTTFDLGNDQNSREAKIANLFMVAANNARKRAEKRHDFSFADVSVFGDIPSDNTGLGYDDCYMTRYEGTLVISGGAGVGTLTADADDPMPHNSEDVVLVTDQAGTFTRAFFTLSSHTSPYGGTAMEVEQATPAVVADGTYTVWCYSLTNDRKNSIPFDPERLAKVKTVQACWYWDSDESLYRPIRFTTQQRIYDLLIEHLDTRPDNQVTYEDDWILCFGRKFYTYPTSSEAVTMRFDVNRWFPDYKDDSDEDEFLEYGFDYMLWACVVELNHLLKVFVIRQDGNLPPPTTPRNEALEEFIKWDVYQNEQNQNFQLD